MNNIHRLYKITISQDKENGLWVAEVPALSPCITYGETMQEAMEMIKEAMEAVIESRIANGYDIPDDVLEYENKRTPFEVTMPYSHQGSFNLATA